MEKITEMNHVSMVVQFFCGLFDWIEDGFEKKYKQQP